MAFTVISAIYGRTLPKITAAADSFDELADITNVAEGSTCTIGATKYVFDEVNGWGVASDVGSMDSLKRNALKVIMTVETDQTNNQYKVHTFIPQMGREIGVCAPAGAAYDGDGRIVICFVLSAKSEKFVSWSAVRYYSKSWEHSYDPDVDGLLTDKNAPASSTWTPAYEDNPFNVLTFRLAGSTEAGDFACVRCILTINYSDGTTEKITSAQIKATRMEDGSVSTKFYYDTETVNSEDNVICAGWSPVTNHHVACIESGDVYPLWSNAISQTVKDRCAIFTPNNFMVNGEPHSLAQWLVFGNGEKRYYGVLSNPGILTEEQAPAENP